jgi:hypothetical protein
MGETCSTYGEIRNVYKIVVGNLEWRLVVVRQYWNWCWRNVGEAVVWIGCSGGLVWTRYETCDCTYSGGLLHQLNNCAAFWREDGARIWAKGTNCRLMNGLFGMMWRLKADEGHKNRQPSPRSRDCCGNRQSWSVLRYCLGIFLTGLKKTTKNISIFDLGLYLGPA